MIEYVPPPRVNACPICGRNYLENDEAYFIEGGDVPSHFAFLHPLDLKWCVVADGVNYTFDLNK